MTTDVEDLSRQFMRAAERLPTLWELGQEWDRLLTLLEEPEQDAGAIQAELERVAGDIKRKARDVAVVLHALERKAEWQKAEGQRMANKAKQTQANADRLKAYALSCMKAIDVDRIDTGTHTLSVRLNNPSVNVLDAAAIPGEFNRTKIEITPDKIAILAHVKATGEIPPGVEIVRNESLRVS